MMVRAGYRVRRCLGVLFATLCAVMLTAQVVVMPDSMYFRMVDEATATKAMRFDLTAYRDTLRAYRDALDAMSTGIDASNLAGEARRSRLGLLREDLRGLDTERATLRKRVKRHTATHRQNATDCGLFVARIRQLRGRLSAEGVRLPR
ncbi:MAG: hypothetical protein U0U25_01995 [Flavobacteriales bacterium]